MSVNINDNGILRNVAGGVLYADNPIGSVLDFGGSSLPPGWHACDGTAVSRIMYHDLFDVIGTAFGPGDGSTTFNLPNITSSTQGITCIIKMNTVPVPADWPDDYEDLEHLPQIASVTLKGNKSLADLGIASAADLTTANENISDLQDANAVNMIPFPYSAGSGSNNGVTWVVNADGTITISTAEGGATGTQYIGLVLPAKHVTIPDGDYCLHTDKVDGITLIVDAYNKTTLTSVKRYASTDEETTFTKDDGDAYYTALVVTVAEGTEIATPVTIKPMLEIGSVAHSFVPYIGAGKTIPDAIRIINDNMDGWTSTSQVDSNGQVAFTGLSDSLAYSLFVENKLVSITSVTKTGSGNNVTLTYTLSGAETGDVCKLRISK